MSGLEPRLKARQRQLLLDAADYIEKHGWHQRGYRGWTGSVCLVGALMMVSRDLREQDFENQCDLLYNRVCKYLRGKYTLDWGRVSLEGWNDFPDRTKEEVLAALRGAADE